MGLHQHPQNTVHKTPSLYIRDETMLGRNLACEAERAGKSRLRVKLEEMLTQSQASEPWWGRSSDSLELSGDSSKCQTSPYF